MDDDRMDVSFETLLGAQRVADLFARFDAYPGLVSDLGLATLGYLAENTISEVQRQRFAAIYALAEAFREHGGLALAREFDRIGVIRVHDDFGGYWPVLLSNLGATYANGEHGQAPAIEPAIACFTGALRCIGPGDNLELWANATIGLGRAYLKRTEGDPVANAHRALTLFLDAREATSPTQSPLAWAEASAEFGTGAVNVLADHDLAIRCYSEALTIYRPERDWGWWVRTQLNLADALLKRSSDAADAEQAVTLLEAILARSAAGMGPVPGSVFSRLGGAYLQCLCGSYAENRERAIANLTRALELPGDDAARATIWSTLGTAYRDRLHGDRAANIERAIDCFERSLACQNAVDNPKAWASTQSGLAHAYLFRLRGTHAENISAAIRCARDVTERASFAGLAPNDRLDALNALGAAYQLRQTGDRAADIEQAIRLFEEAIALATGQDDPLTQAKMLSNLGLAYVNRVLGDADDNREIGIGHFEAALKHLDGQRADPARARNLLNLGLALLTRRRGDPAGNLERAAACFRAADESGATLLGAAPRLRRHMVEAQARLALGPASWPTAQTRLDEAFDLFADRWDEAITPEGRRELVATTSQAGRWSALIQAAAGDYARGLERVEASRAIVLREVLALDASQWGDVPFAQCESIAAARRRIVQLRAEAGSPATAADRYLALTEELMVAQGALTAALAGLPERPQPLGVAAMLAAIPAGAVLIIPVATEFGSLVYVVPSGTALIEARHVVDMPGLTSDDVRRQLATWLHAYYAAWADFGNSSPAHTFQARWQAASETLDAVLGWLGQTVMAPVLARIAALAPSPQPDAEAPELVIMPTGEFALFPFHAAVHQRDGVRRSVIEDFPVSYTPSLQALQAARARHTHRAPGGQELLALMNPTDDLRFSESVELPALRRLFPAAGAAAIRVGAAASKAALREQAPGTRYVHLSCHGRFDAADPEQSGLKLAEPEWLTAREIAAEVELEGCRWVMLSACETGMTDVTQTPDEAAGLVAAFQMAGAPCVLASLWVVPDNSTALFVAKVYEEHRAYGLAPARALRRAALWLKELPADALQALLGSDDDTVEGVAPRFAEIGAETGASGAFLGHGGQPFASPLFWAPFAVWGV